ncbi:helix-turn-helix domain-containing protein [Mycolicibacter sinensis]|uniref:helix-turn-helix domain-containing protein n=1 Tax=Mycolicibacter sinensis (strain JDM601) TaxID=875328 RepID=UPI000A800485|nr:helix-turn-helix transcriptional regulator [Mycolicibacter sinensis]
MGVADGVPAADRLGVDLARSENHLIRELIAVRQRRGLKPADVARAMGVDRSAVTRFESGGTNPTMATINRYAEAVGAMIRYTVETTSTSPALSTTPSSSHFTGEVIRPGEIGGLL